MPTCLTVALFLRTSCEFARDGPQFVYVVCGVA